MGLRKASQILYVGEDKSYWQRAKEAFTQTYQDRDFDFQEILLKNDLPLRAFYRGICQNPPKILLADLSTAPETILRLVFDLKNEFKMKTMVVLGLIDHKSSAPELPAMAIGLGVSFVFAKQAGLEILTHHAFVLAFPGMQRPLNIRRDPASVDTSAVTYLKLGFVTNAYLHFEANFKFLAGQHLKLQTRIFPQITLSNGYQVVRRSEKNTYSCFNYWYEAQYVHPKGQEAALSGQIEKWFEENRKTSRPKRSRLLAIDKTLAVFGEGKSNFDDYHFSLRCCSQLDPNYQMLEKFYPGVIAYQIELPAPGAKRLRGPVPVDRNNDHFELERIVDKIKSMKGYTPFIFIFNYDGEVKDFQDFLHYQYILTNKNPIGLDVLATVMEAYEKGRGKNVTHIHQTKSEPELERYYISKYDPRSLAAYEINLKGIKVSDYDLVFSAIPDLPPYTTFYVPAPYNMVLEIVPNEKLLSSFPKFKGRQNYYALIHAFNPEDLAKLKDPGAAAPGNPAAPKAKK